MSERTSPSYPPLEQRRGHNWRPAPAPPFRPGERYARQWAPGQGMASYQLDCAVVVQRQTPRGILWEGHLPRLGGKGPRTRLVAVAKTLVEAQLATDRVLLAEQWQLELTAQEQALLALRAWDALMEGLCP